MTHRTDIVAVERAAPLAALVALQKEERYSRLPVYEGDLDDIVGIVYLKDIIPALSGEDDGAKTAADFMQPVLYVPETMRCSELLRQFKEKKQRMAVVVDEYGGTEGLVTMEDLLEAIVGMTKTAALCSFPKTAGSWTAKRKWMMWSTCWAAICLKTMIPRH